ncbi:DeoR/GlpR family DNA-binding transcription regulator [Amycolatopsis alkalitolerans]|uniref:DeoR/GlpR transcriptional regulator n=1 Tax=Amycolatopsis alkalitolerans TaxID=2547244 RepID=A0A5C4LXX9_9PSEU|nr:DeoR/GlpR family DNA-binding transcription regulator [Amycolatopsis alkalitolerans]TNC24548.1 DeoR/GlpR transcriptional regulator [Amycolatopsis alkalitolerans]
MDRHERLNALLEMVGQRARIDVEESARELRVSPATIRRDLDHLAGRQLLTRTRGGATASNVAYDLPLRQKTAGHAAQKHRIGLAAARLAHRGMVIGIAGGTTATEVSRALATRPEFNEGDATLTVVTNALNIAHELTLRPSIKVVTTGGVARTRSFELTGPLAAPVLNELSLDLVFIGAGAVDPVRGLYAGHEAEASVNRLFTRHAQKVVAVADSSKLGAFAFARICGPADIQTLITDTDADPAQVAAFERAGVEVIRA